MTEGVSRYEQSQVFRLATRAELVIAAGDDRYVSSSAPTGAAIQAWRSGCGVAWFSRAPHRAGAGWLTVVAPARLVPALVSAAVADSAGAVAGLTVPAGALELLPDDLRPPTYNLWDWFWTISAPPRQPGEAAVTWASEDDAVTIAALLDGHSPRHSARPGEASVRRFCVLRDETGDVAACAAHIEYVAGVPHLASIVTRTDLRGRGLAAAITAWLTRQLLDEGESVVTLGMYGDNDVARRLYRRLGFTDSHHWASGALQPESAAPSESVAPHGA